MADQKKDRYVEAARRLFAAYVSWHDGISLEQAYKQYATSSSQIGTYWIELAERVDREMMALKLKALSMRTKPTA